jgi:hypothetical protein
VTRSDQTCSGGLSRFRLPIVLATLLMVILPLGARAEPKAAVDPDLTKSDAALLQDDAKATAELQRRLRDQVSSRGGLLVIVDRSGTNPGVTVVPATIMWGVDCGESGLAVTFGTGSGDSDNGVVLQLTNATIADDKCLRIAPALGDTVLALTKGN